LNRKQKTSSNDHAAALDNFGSSTSPGRTARFEKCGPAGEYFAFQKLKNKRGKRHGQRQGRRSRQPIAVALLIENAAIRIVKMDGEKIREPATSVRTFMRMRVRVVERMRIDLEELLRSRTVATSAVNQAVHLAQHGRKQEHQG
jgi:intracellular sulfur oxidation DsrE/DsrF family protein